MDGELIEYLDEKFNKIEVQISVVKVNMEEGFKEAKSERQELKETINATYNSVDKFIKIVDRLETEFNVLKTQVDRLEGRLNQLEEKVK